MEKNPMVEGHTTDREYREVLVVPLAARREALALVGAILLIILLMGVRFSLIPSKNNAIKALPSYQIYDITLTNQAPMLYRSLLTAVADIEDLRDESGAWPRSTRLQKEVIPPFDASFLPVGLRGFQWKSYPHKGWVDYHGINKDVGSEDKESVDPLENSFVLRIIDLQSKDHPHPHFGRDKDPNVRYSAQIWMNPQHVEYPGANLVTKGWKWVVQEGATSSGVGAAVLSEKAGQ